MKEKPILFNGEMVRAILDDRKTQTRRVIKPQPGINPGSDFVDGAWFEQDQYGDSFSILERCPYGQPGDNLWVRETFCPVDDREFGGGQWIDYRATPKYHADHPAGWDNESDDPDAAKWKPSIHMPRTACRIILKVVNVRVERVQDITFDDAIDEGILPFDKPVGITAIKAYEIFIELWDSINEKRGFGWDENPWVWVVEFKRIGQ